MSRPPTNHGNRPPKPPTSYRLSFLVDERNVLTLRDDLKEKLISGHDLFQEKKNVQHLEVSSKGQAQKARECLIKNGVEMKHEYFCYDTSKKDAKELDQYHEYDPIIFKSFIGYMNQCYEKEKNRFNIIDVTISKRE